ncbi:hypothetical protein HNQ77_003097 [Silvibacterium bohemicum]|uniref:Uncharacterized protein n=1 Tax=Silvibacterium bohemicum TaxID=1577686 RepID=A0A841JZL2_9BACT|nr:hypothetical protein [Silvibacterium bohemicum]
MGEPDSLKEHLSVGIRQARSKCKLATRDTYDGDRDRLTCGVFL